MMRSVVALICAGACRASSIASSEAPTTAPPEVFTKSRRLARGARSRGSVMGRSSSHAGPVGDMSGSPFEVLGAQDTVVGGARAHGSGTWGIRPPAEDGEPDDQAL